MRVDESFHYAHGNIKSTPNDYNKHLYSANLHMDMVKCDLHRVLCLPNYLLSLDYFIFYNNCSGAVGPMFLAGPRAVLFRQSEIFFRQTKNFSRRQHFKSFPTTLTIFRRISTIGGGAWPPPATAPLNNCDITFLTVFILPHPVNFSCGRKPEHPEKTQDF